MLPILLRPKGHSSLFSDPHLLQKREAGTTWSKLGTKLKVVLSEARQPLSINANESFFSESDYRTSKTKEL